MFPRKPDSPPPPTTLIFGAAGFTVASLAMVLVAALLIVHTLTVQTRHRIDEVAVLLTMIGMVAGLVGPSIASLGLWLATAVQLGSLNPPPGSEDFDRQQHRAVRSRRTRLMDVLKTSYAARLWGAIAALAIGFASLLMLVSPADRTLPVIVRYGPLIGILAPVLVGLGWVWSGGLAEIIRREVKPPPTRRADPFDSEPPPPRDAAPPLPARTGPAGGG